MKRYLFYCLLLVIAVSCSDRQANTLNGVQYVINLDGEREASIPLSYIFKDVKTIVLETSEKCLIGRITELQVLGGYIYVLDRLQAKGLFVFDMEGRFVRKIGTMGKGPGEYIRIDDFTLDADNGFIFLCDQANRIHKYRLDGTYEHSITVRANATVRFIQYYKNRLYADLFSGKKDPNECMLAEIDLDSGEILSQSLPLRNDKGWGDPLSSGSFFISRLNHPPKYTRSFMDFIVSAGEPITPYIALQGRDLMTEEDIKELSNGTLSDRFKALTRGSKMWGVTNFVENDDFVIFGMSPSLVVVFHKKKGTVQLADQLNDDLIFKESIDKSISRWGGFICSDVHGAYSTVPLSQWSDFQGSLRNNEVRPELDKLYQLVQLNEESNPVLFFYEFK